MKKLLFVSAIFFLSQNSFCQANAEAQKRVESSNDPKLAEFKAKHDDVISKNTQPIQSATYFGYDETLKSFFSNGIIPNETPKSDGTLSKEQYVKVLNEWLSKNKNFLKPEHTNSLIK